MRFDAFIFIIDPDRHVVFHICRTLCIDNDSDQFHKFFCPVGNGMAFARRADCHIACGNSADRAVIAVFCCSFENIKQFGICFMDMITDTLNMKKMKVGFNYHFGRKGMGNAGTLRKMAEERGFELRVADAFTIDGITVSSTAIREFITKGDIALANRFLGHPYSFEGRVKEGKKLGRRIGIPTVNLEIDPRKVLPKRGVYVSRVIIGEETFYGISNVGKNPTFNEHIKVETHVFDFDRDVYGEYIRVELLEFEREERVFESIDELISTINKSIEFGREYVKSNNLN